MFQKNYKKNSKNTLYRTIKYFPHIYACFCMFLHMHQQNDSILKKFHHTSGLLRFQNALTTNFYKISLTWEIDYYSYKKFPDKNSGFKNLEKSGRVATLFLCNFLQYL